MCIIDVNVLRDCTWGMYAHCQTLKVSALKDNTARGKKKKKKKNLMHEEKEQFTARQMKTQENSPPASRECVAVRYALR